MREQKIPVAAHGDNVRALSMHLDDIPDEEIPGLSIPNGLPLVYELDRELITQRRYCLE